MRFEPRPFTYTIGCNLFRAYFRIFHKLEVHGRELCPAKGPLIIVANHASYLDPPLIAVAYRMRRVRFLAKIELWGTGFLKWYLTNIGTIPIERGSGGKDAIDLAVEIAKAGGCLGIFPEGTRTKTGELGRGRSGAIVIAARTGAPLLPVYIEGTYQSLPSGASRVKFNPIVAYTGEPFELTPEQRDLNDRVTMRKTAELVMAKIAEARERYVENKQAMTLPRSAAD